MPKLTNEETSLLNAAEINDLAVVRQLVSRGTSVVNVNRRGVVSGTYVREPEASPLQFGNRPLHWAAENNNAEMAGLLLEKGAYVNAQNRVSDPRPSRAKNKSIRQADGVVIGCCISHTCRSVQQLFIWLLVGIPRTKRFGQIWRHCCCVMEPT